MDRDKFEKLKGPDEAHLLVGKKQKEHIDKALKGPTKKETTCVSNDGNLSFDPKWANIKKKPGKTSARGPTTNNLKKWASKIRSPKTTSEAALNQSQPISF